MDVHARDVLVELNEKNVSKSEDFKWLCHLRYYWIVSNEKSTKSIIMYIQSRFHYLEEIIANCLTECKQANLILRAKNKTSVFALFGVL